MLTLRFAYKVYSYHNDGLHCSREGKVCEFEDKAHYCTEALLCLAPALQNNLTFIQLVCLRLELSISYWKWISRCHTNCSWIVYLWLLYKWPLHFLPILCVWHYCWYFWNTWFRGSGYIPWHATVEWDSSLCFSSGGPVPVMMVRDWMAQTSFCRERITLIWHSTCWYMLAPIVYQPSLNSADW